MTEPYGDEEPSVESHMKQRAWEAFLQSWKVNNRGDMDLDQVHIDTARTQFERWYGREYE